MTEWMYAHDLPVDDHPKGCTCGGCDGPVGDESSILCMNCIDDVYMVEQGDGLYRCPVCGDEYDPTYPCFDGDLPPDKD